MFEGSRVCVFELKVLGLFGVESLRSVLGLGFGLRVWTCKKT